MAINDPRAIGIAVRCIKCKWIFRCPAEQPYRVRCYACAPKRRQAADIVEGIRYRHPQAWEAAGREIEAEKAIFDNHIGPIEQ